MDEAGSLQPAPSARAVGEGRGGGMPSCRAWRRRRPVGGQGPLRPPSAACKPVCRRNGAFQEAPVPLRLPAAAPRLPSSGMARAAQSIMPLRMRCQASLGSMTAYAPCTRVHTLRYLWGFWRRCAMPGGDGQKCPCRCHYGGAVSCPGCKDMHRGGGEAPPCPHCARP